MNKPERKDYNTDVEFQIAYMQWRQWVNQQREEL
jgi:hypothetical protein